MKEAFTIQEEEGSQPEPSCCNHLGTDHDSAVCFSYPNKQNYCYKLDHPSSIALNHQDEYCLTKEYVSCSLYQQENKVRKAPKEIIAKTTTKKKKKRARTTLLFILGIAITGIIFSLAFLKLYGLQNIYFPITTSNINPDNSPPSSEDGETPTYGDVVDLLFLFPQKTQTSTSDTAVQVENTPHPTSGPQFGALIGEDGLYLLHKVASGESLHYLADLYDSDAETIRIINCLPEGFPIIANQVLVIKPGEKRTINLDCFNVVKIEEDTPLETIASSYGTTPEELTELNYLGEITIIPAGRWLIVPAE